MAKYIIRALTVFFVFPTVLVAFRYLLGMPAALMLGDSPPAYAVAIVGFTIFGLAIGASVWVCKKLWKSAEEYATDDVALSDVVSKDDKTLSSG